MSMIVALILPFALLQSDAAPTPGAGNDRFQQCIALIDDDAPRAYEEAMAWAADTQSVQAYRCAAMALIGQNRYAEGARRLQSLANAVNPAETALRSSLWSQSGNAYLLARQPSEARSVLTRAIVTMEGDPTQLPDLLIDRARAYAMERDWRHSEEDLSRSLDIRPENALALRLRAAARMQQRSFDLAQADAMAAIRLEPQNQENTLILGDIRESIRIGAPFERN
jgi:tetratricopeptide (TPR) repeat protein